MSTKNSVSCWIAALKDGEESAATKIWQRYYEQLLRLAQLKLRGFPRKSADEEDVVAMTLGSLFLGAQNGRFPRLHDRHDLWQLLVKITEHKAVDQIRAQTRLRRGGGKIRGESAMKRRDTSPDETGMDGIIGSEPEPEFAAAMLDTLDHLLTSLSPDLRELATLKLEGYTNKEIAAKIRRSVATVERRLKLIRDKWREEDVP